MLTANLFARSTSSTLGNGKPPISMFHLFTAYMKRTNTGGFPPFPRISIPHRSNLPKILIHATGLRIVAGSLTFSLETSVWDLTVDGVVDIGETPTTARDLVTSQFESHLQGLDCKYCFCTYKVDPPSSLHGQKILATETRS